MMQNAIDLEKTWEMSSILFSVTRSDLAGLDQCSWTDND